MKSLTTMQGQNETPENPDHGHSLLLSDYLLTVRLTVQELGLGKSFVHTILTEQLQMKNFALRLCHDCSRLRQNRDEKSVALTEQP